MGRDRAIVDDPAAPGRLAAHEAKGGTGAEEHAGDVGAADLQPLIDRDFVNRGGGDRDASVVEQDIEAGKCSEGGLDPGRVTNVARKDAGGVAGGGFPQRIGAAAKERNLPPGGKKGAGGGAADAGPGPGDQDRTGPAGTSCRKSYFRSQTVARAAATGDRPEAVAASTTVRPGEPAAA